MERDRQWPRRHQNASGSIEDALKEYEIVREEVVKGLRIACIQRKIKRKITGTTGGPEEEEIELNFCRPEELAVDGREDEYMDNMSLLLSEDARPAEMTGRRTPIFQQDGLEAESSAEESSGVGEAETDGRVGGDQAATRNIRHGSGLVDIEAEYSGEEYSEEKNESEYDLEDFVDNEQAVQEESADYGADRLFYQERDEADAKHLRSLKRKYTKAPASHQPSARHSGQYRIMTASDSESLPTIEEIDLDRIEFTDLVAPFEQPLTEERPYPAPLNLSPNRQRTRASEEDADLFNTSNAAALDRLARKTDSASGFGFSEKRDP